MINFAKAIAFLGLAGLVQGDSSDDSGKKEDVCVLGGGASGSFIAWNLQQRDYDVVLIEPKDHLVGNCDTKTYYSTANPGETYTFDAGVVVLPPTPIVTNFIDQFEADLVPRTPLGGATIAYLPGQSYLNTFLAPQPDQDEFQALQDALEAYIYLVKSKLEGVNPLTYAKPYLQLFSEETASFLFQPFGEVLRSNPSIEPLTPIIAAFIQGNGFLPAIPVWQVLTQVSPRFIAYFFGVEGSYFLQFENGCQTLYDEIEVKMIEEDPSSVKTSTSVNEIKRFGDHVKVWTSEGLYECNDAIVAFRPNGLGSDILSDISSEEEAFFGSLGQVYSYAYSIWNMNLGPSLQHTLGADKEDPEEDPKEDPMSFVNAFATFLDMGITTLQKGPGSDWPWLVYFQGRAPFDEDSDVDLIEKALTTIGFVDIELLEVDAHKYSMKPQEYSGTLAWKQFFDQANGDDDHLYWAGALPAMFDSTETVWEHAAEEILPRFPEL